jgi:hypothetical protein
MSKSKKNNVVKQSFRKELKKQIAFQLTNNLEELKTLLGDKKFSTRIRKATKLLSSGVKEKTNTPVKAKKKAPDQPKTQKSVSVAEPSSD